MSLIRLSLRKKRFVNPTPPPSTALAVPRGAVNGWGTAADFYDSVGVNVHTVAGFPNNGPTQVIPKIADLGMRHIRDAAIPSWNQFWMTGAGGRQLYVPLRTRNRALPTPTSTDQGHPIFFGTITDPWGPGIPTEVTRMNDQFRLGQSTFNPALGAKYRITYGVDFTPQGLMQMFGGGHFHVAANTAVNAPISQVGNPIADSATAPNPATVVPSPWAYSDAECPWEIVAYVGGPNEPNTGGAGVAAPVPGSAGVNDSNKYSTMAKQLSPWMHALWVAKQAQTGTGYGKAGTLSGFNRIVTEAGLVTTRPNITQIPVVGYVSMNIFWVYDDAAGGSLQSAQSDMSKGSPNEIDMGDWHQYAYAEEPSVARKNGLSGAGEIGYTNDAHSYFIGKHDPYNGSQTPTPSGSRPMDPNRALPTMHTEWAMCDRAGPNPSSFGSTRFVIGQWPSPKDVNAEYTVRQFLMAWNWGVRRTYYYQLVDERNDVNPEYNLGLYDSAGVIKPSGLAIKNLLKLVGFSEPVADKRKLAVTISGYPTGQFNDHLGSAVEQVAPYNVVAHRNVKQLHNFQIQQDDDNWLLVLCPQVTLWDQVPGNRNAGDTGWASLGNPTAGRKTPSTSTLTITVPPEITDAQVAWPTRGLTPNGATHTWTTPTDGLTWDTLTINANRQITVDIDRYTKLVKLTRGGSPTPSPELPIVVPAVGSTPAALRKGAVNGPRINLKGANVWGLPDNITNNVSISGTAFHQHQYAARTTICNTLQGWGANCVRLRMSAVDYNGAPSANTDSITKAQIIDRADDWQQAMAAEGMYTVFCPWDGLDGAYSGANFPAQYTNTFQLYTDLYARFGDDPWVMYETPNEPNGITMAQWQTIMQGYSSHFRDTLGYTGVIVMDPPNWANSGGSTSPAGNPAGYSDVTYSAVEAFDAARTGMGGKHQLVFAKHDYSNNSGYPSNVFSATNWANGMGGADIKHLIWANEFGNFNAGGPDPDTNAQWVIDYSIAARDRWATKTNYVGAAPFLFGPWSDANRLTDNDNVTATAQPTGWGPTARDYYFGSSTPPPPPPSGGLTPGVHFNGDVQGAANGAVSLGAKIVRVEFAAAATATSLDATFTYYADRGLKILLLAAIGTPTLISSGTAANLGTWATRFGPGGTFWASYGGTDRPISHIEFGNESNFNWQCPPPNNSGTPGYAAKARTYATIFTAAYNAIQAANPAVGLLCQGTANDSGDPSWVNNLFVQEPGLAARVNGWTVHPYSPAWASNMNNYVSHLASRDPNKPIDITEIGISTDNGRALNNNYNWPVNLTYSQAATSLQGVIVGMHQQSWWPRIRHWIYYQSLDNQDSGTSIEREAYFGGLQRLGQEKGAYSTQVRTIMAMTS